MSFPSASIRTKTWVSEILTAADLHSQFDLLHTYLSDALNATTGHAHTGGESQGPKISLSAAVSGILPIANGGTGVVNVIDAVYPIGSIYISTVSTNPNTLFGAGTWVAFGEGKFLVGLDITDGDFDVSESTGGAKTHTLTANEMPAHTHTLAETDQNSGGTSAIAQASNQVSSNVTQSTGSAGGGAAHNNLPPFIVAYFWKRTA